MTIFVIGDRDTVLGFRLVGASGRAVENAEEARRGLEEALRSEEIALLCITREWADAMRESIDRLKMERLRPIVMEIPGTSASFPEGALEQLVRRVIGIRV